MDPSESENRPASCSDSSEQAQTPSSSSQHQQQSAGDISVAGDENAFALANAAGNVAIDQSQRGNIRIEESTVGSAIISGDGNIIYVVHQAIEQKSRQDSVEATGKVGPNPYKGLAAFKENNADQYFGREAQVERLWQRFQALYEQSGQVTAVSKAMPRLLPILGPSGSGKSSLARAGLIPSLARHPLPGKEQMRIAVLVPGTHPVEALAGVLAKAATQDPMPVAKTREFATELKLKNEAGIYDGMRRIVDLMPQIKDTPLIVLVDQFEEVYSLCQDADEREAFIDNLLCAASSPTGNVSVVLTLRSDFLGETQRHEWLTQVIGSDQSMIVPGMTEAELRRAIAEPAKQAGHPLDAATVNLLVKDTEGREGALPLLQFALTRIWAGLSEGKAPADTYEAMGGVGGALAGKAQDIYNELDDTEKDMVRRVFIGLVQLGEGTRDTRRRAAISSLMASRDTPEAMKQVIHRFSSPGARLVTLSSQAGKEIAEVTHEALFDHWQLLNDWLDSSRDDIRFQRRLDAAADYWKEQGSPEGNLWRRPDLDLLKSYHRQASQEMTPLQLRFFRASMRADRQRKILSGIGVGALVVLSGATSLLAITAQRTKRLSQATQLATKAEWIGSQSTVLRTTSALLAVRASKTFEKNLHAPLEVDRALRSGLKSLPFFKKQFNHKGWLNAASYSPDGKTIATASGDKTAGIWNAQTGEKIATLNHEAVVISVNYSPDSKTITTASGDKTAGIWNAQTGEKIATLNHEAVVISVNYSPDSKTITTASGDKTA
ncbi:MAG: AAA family ATPase, partial [Cyanobacteria bacterium P01_F01_bin.86]